MRNFDYQTPTRLIFGRDVVAGLPEVMRPFGRRVLLTYGGGSIKRIGLYDRVRELLKDFEIFELGGIEPNPKYSTSVVEGVRICKEQHIDVILSVGGGSVLDCSKAIAGGAKYDGETWDLITGKAPTLAALPIVDILTLAATGSEYDAGGVISRTETNDKIAYIDPHLFPACSFLDPTYTFTVNAKHTAAGVADAINHVMEQYFTHASNSVADGFCETLVKTLMKYAPVAWRSPMTMRPVRRLCMPVPLAATACWLLEQQGLPGRCMVLNMLFRLIMTLHMEKDWPLLLRTGCTMYLMSVHRNVS